MQVGEIFVTLGLKGAGKAKKDLKGVSDEMTGISKRSLAAVAAIAGVGYGFKALYDKAIATGQGFTKFSAYTEESTKQLQQWQYAARQYGVGAEEVEGSIRGLQQAVGQIQITGEVPKMFQMIADAVDIDYSKLEDTYYIMKKFQQFAQDKRFTVAAKNQALGEFISPEMISFLKQNKIDVDKARPNMLSDRQSLALQRIGASAAELKNTIEKDFAKVLIDLGPALITSLNKLIPLIDSLTRLIIKSIGSAADFLSDPSGNLKDLGTGLTEKTFWQQLFKDAMPWTYDKLQSLSVPNGTGMTMQDRLSQSIIDMKNGGSGSLGNVTFEQNFNFNGVNPDSNNVGRAARLGAQSGLQGAGLKTATKGN